MIHESDVIIWQGEIHCMTSCGERPNPETLRNTMLHVWIENKPTKETTRMARGVQRETMWYYKNQWKRKFKKGFISSENQLRIQNSVH